MGWVRALFDYDGSSGTELSFKAGDVIETISDTPVDDWLEGILAGRQGFFPFNYVEIVDAPAEASQPVPQPPPPPEPEPEPEPQPAPVPVPMASGGGGGGGGGGTATVLYDFEGQGGTELTLTEGTIVTIINRDEGEGWCLVKTPGGTEGLFPNAYLEFGGPAVGGTAADAPAPSFSSSEVFAKDEEEPFVDVFADVDKRLSVLNLTGLPTEQFTVNDGMWVPAEELYVIELHETEKKKKFGGMKHFISYVIATPSKELACSRRYKHFDWLRQQMVEKFPLIAVPPLPVKQYSGRFQEDFINRRRRDLEEFLNRCSGHPVLRSSAVFMHFLMANDETTWKKGKRVAEKDAQKGSYFFRNVTADAPPPKEVDAEIVRFKANIKAFDKQLARIDQANEKLHHTSQALKHDGLRYAESFDAIATGDEAGGGLCWRTDCATAYPFKSILEHVGKLESDEFEAHATMLGEARDELAHMLRDHTAIIPTIHDILKVRESAMYTYMTAYSKSVKANRAMTQEEEKNLAAMKARCDIITNIMRAEMDHYHAVRLADFKKELRKFMVVQTNLHKQMAEKWDAAIAELDGNEM